LKGLGQQGVTEERRQGSLCRNCQAGVGAGARPPRGVGAANPRSLEIGGHRNSGFEVSGRVCGGLRQVAIKLAEGSQRQRQGGRRPSGNRFGPPSASSADGLPPQPVRQDGQFRPPGQWSRAGLSKLALQQLRQRAAAGREPGRRSAASAGAASDSKRQVDRGGREAIAQLNRERPHSADAHAAATVWARACSTPEQGLRRRAGRVNRQGDSAAKNDAAHSDHQRLAAANSQHGGAVLPISAPVLVSCRFGSSYWVLQFAALAVPGGLFLWIGRKSTWFSMNPFPPSSAHRPPGNQGLEEMTNASVTAKPLKLMLRSRIEPRPHRRSVGQDFRIPGVARRGGAGIHGACLAPGSFSAENRPHPILEIFPRST